MQKEEESELHLNPNYEDMVKGETTDRKCGDVPIDIFEKIRIEYDNGGENATKYIFVMR